MQDSPSLHAILLLFIVLAPFASSVIAAMLPGDARRREAWLAGGTAFAGLVATLLLYGDIAQGKPLRLAFAWMPAQNVEFVLRMDGLAWAFALLILAIGVLVVVYARYYMSPEDPVPRFFSFLLAFMGSMLGIVLSGNLIQLVVFWELTSLTSFLLIGYWHHRIDARRGARMSFVVTAAGGLCLLAGMLLLGQMAGSYDLDQVLGAGPQVREHPWYTGALVLIAIGALSKSAQFPFHFWLPHAMAAPTPVSAYLHSATMVKAGVFLLMRLWPVLSGTAEWTWIIAGAGVVTLLIGSFAAIFQNDLKGLLAYSTISHIGLITLMLGMGSRHAMVAAIFHTFNHATFKASLFMAAGIIDHETGTRDMRHLRGLYRVLPYTGTLAIVASAAMAGVPLLNGFLSKEMFFAETLTANTWWLPIAAVAMGIFSVTYSLRLISVFFGKLPDDLPKRHPHEPPRWMRFPVDILVLVCLLVGIAPNTSIGPTLVEAVGSVLGDSAPAYNLSLWHGFEPALLMSILALLGGIAFYMMLRRFFGLAERSETPVLSRLSGASLFEITILYLSSFSSRLMRFVGTQRLQPQLLAMLLLMIAAPVVLLRPAIGGLAATPSTLDPGFAILWLVGCTCALAAAWQAKYHRLAAMILVSGTGAITSVTFLWLSAPDLALTQLMVETVTTVLLLLGLRWLPPRILPYELDLEVSRLVWLRRARDLVIAIAGGAGIAVLSYLVLTSPQDNAIGEFFLLETLVGGGGTNAVNVLLVDFRGFDTMGEISVLAIVALTIYALLRRFRPAAESIALPAEQATPVDPVAAQTPAEQTAPGGYLYIPSVYLRLLLPLMAIAVAYFFLRGHNLPGGGFVAGLIFATAIIVQYMTGGTMWVESHLRLWPHRWLGAGLLAACGTGLGAWVAGYPFLTSHVFELDLPGFGVLHLPSAAVFDLGVFLVVVGAVMLILVALAHQSVRSHRALVMPVPGTDALPAQAMPAAPPRVSAGVS